ncbi:MAG: hypothetical protein ABSH29_19005 [Acidimicrobiales bacterium]
MTRNAGIHHVWVNGVLIWSEGVPVPDRRLGLPLGRGVNPPLPNDRERAEKRL